MAPFLVPTLLFDFSSFDVSGSDSGFLLSPGSGTPTGTCRTWMMRNQALEKMQQQQYQGGFQWTVLQFQHGSRMLSLAPRPLAPAGTLASYLLPLLICNSWLTSRRYGLGDSGDATAFTFVSALTHLYTDIHVGWFSAPFRGLKERRNNAENTTEDDALLAGSESSETSDPGASQSDASHPVGTWARRQTNFNLASTSDSSPPCNSGSIRIQNKEV